MVELENICLSYDKKNKVLKDFSLNIKQGECVLFTGESGSGKTSVINAINGLASRYDKACITGNIKINGLSTKDLEIYQISKLISTVFQNPKTYFFNVNTTLELLFYLENLGFNREEMDRRMEKMLSIFPIEHLLNRDIFKLSGGEKQILCVASCYMAGTKIIVLDEPSSNLDAQYIEVLSNMLKILKAEKISLIISEHRIYYLMNVVDRIILLENGKIKKEYTSKELSTFTNDVCIKLGLRSVNKTKLTKGEPTSSGDLLIKNFVYKFDGFNSQLAIDNMSFQLGKIYGIIGKNGCGKTTFVHSLIGIEKSSKEEVYLNDKKLSKKQRLTMSSLVMQDVNHQLFSDEVLEEVVLGVKNPNKEKAISLLKDLNMYDYIDRHPMSLSGGQKQRLAIASVLYKNSRFIFFDEPTSGMDYKNMERISALIKQVSTPDNIIFIISHDIEFLNLTVDYTINLEKYRTVLFIP
ncbi:MAG: ABC transporter ATP-binding protein [Treponemataceae bacterium]